MLWRQLMDQHIHSEKFGQQQLKFQKEAYQKIVECYQKEEKSSGQKVKCEKKWEDRLQQYAVAVQWLITQRQKELQRNIMKQCKGNSTQMTNCLNTKTSQFISAHFDKDRSFLSHLRTSLLQS